MIDLDGLNGDAAERSHTMARLHEACKDWGFFWVRKLATTQLDVHCSNASLTLLN